MHDKYQWQRGMHTESILHPVTYISHCCWCILLVLNCSQDPVNRKPHLKRDTNFRQAEDRILMFESSRAKDRGVRYQARIYCCSSFDKLMDSMPRKNI
jgi:hypothetical protein